MNPTADPIIPAQAPCPKCGGDGFYYRPSEKVEGANIRFPCDCRPVEGEQRPDPILPQTIPLGEPNQLSIAGCAAPSENKCPKCGGSGIIRTDDCGAPVPPGTVGYFVSRCDCRPVAPAGVAFTNCTFTPPEPGDAVQLTADPDSPPLGTVVEWNGTGPEVMLPGTPVAPAAEYPTADFSLRYGPPADRGRGETNLAGQRAEVLLCKWADARDRLDELSRTPIPWEKSDAVREKMRKIESHFDAVIAEHDAATAEVGRLRDRLRMMHYWGKCEPDNCNVDGGPEHNEYFASGGKQWASM